MNRNGHWVGLVIVAIVTLGPNGRAVEGNWLVYYQGDVGSHPGGTRTGNHAHDNHLS